LALLFERLSEALEHTARLADEHAARSSHRIDEATRLEELDRAHVARANAERARANAARLKEPTSLAGDELTDHFG
jgi:hypothetical protein